MRDPNEQRPVVMTLREAEQITKTLDQRRRGLVEVIRTLKRKRTPCDASRAMYIADLSMQLETLQNLRESISSVFNINGY